MTIVKCLQLAGLSVCLVGTVLLSLDIVVGTSAVAEWVARANNRINSWRTTLFEIFCLFASIVLLALIITGRFDLATILIQALQMSGDLAIIALAVAAMLLFFAVVYGSNGFRRLGSGLRKMFTFFRDIWRPLFRTRLVERLASLSSECLHAIANPSLLKSQTSKILRVIGQSFFKWFGFVFIAGPAIYAVLSSVNYWTAISITISASLFMGYVIVLLARGLLIVILRVVQVFDRPDRVISRLAFVGLILVSLGFILQIISVVV